MNKLYLVRHGKTDWNVLEKVQGLTDIELNEEGIREAYKLSEEIDFDKIDVCLCSPLKRARKTAEIIVNDRLDIIDDELLVERCYGDFEGNHIEWDIVKLQWNYKLNYSEDNIETIHECMERAKKFLDKIRNEYKDKSILIVSHGGFIKALHFTILGYDDDTDFLTFFPKNTQVYEYDLK